ncbi:hypothetical protein [Geobacter sp. AOG1]|uniref:hypothetical protein n=1 Tax=Geobacter sp. AOG1 TaxID=1566346 RepID=UPI001CC38317|nr:hypothetical protein [Geobacter sp. AOG1]GFE58060.1 hypothetical protein AOG1_19400 [Geobacter sp. AOG1]
MRLTALLTALVLTMPPSAYAFEQHDLEIRSEIFNDNDGTHSLGLDQVFHWKDKTTKVGVGATETVINESGGSRFFAGGLFEGYKKLENVDFTGQLKLIKWNDEVKTPLSLASSQTLGPFRLEESVDHGTIDSVKAYDARIDFWSVGGSLDWELVKNFTITGGYWRRWSSDDNSRDLFVGRAVYSFTDNFHAQYRYRAIRNSERVPEYYSPQHFDQHAILVGYADSFFDRLRLRIWAGPISQYDKYTTHIGALEDVRITWRIDDHWLIAGRAEANQVGSGYQYIYSTLGFTYDF